MRKINDINNPDLVVIYTLGAGFFVQSIVVWGFSMKKRRFKGLSIKTAMALYSVIAISVLTIVISGIGYHLFEKNVKENLVDTHF